MNSRAMGVVVVLMMCIVIGAALTGCDSDMRRVNLGTLGGAVTGSLIGSAVVSGPVGLVIGASAGAYVGHRVGGKFDSVEGGKGEKS